jgi:hypothetical protein
MSRSHILCILALAFGFFVFASSADAHPKQKAKIERLEKRLDKAQDRNRALRAAIAELRTARATTALTPLETALTTISREVAYAERWLRSQNVSFSHEDILSHTAMTYVTSHVSAPMYGWWTQMQGMTIQPTPDAVLGSGAGICGHAALTFAAILKRFGLQVRSVQFYHGASGHIALEVWYGGAWHFYDPTYGAVYKNGTHVMSMAQARAHPNPSSVLSHYRTMLGYELAVIGGWESRTDLKAETAPTTRVEYGQQPF